MAEIEEMKIENENTKTEEIRIDNRVTLTKVYVGGDDFIVISGNDISIFDRFRAAGDELTALAEEMEKKESADGEMDYKKEIEERKYFSEKATAIMDGVFGEGSLSLTGISIWKRSAGQRLVFWPKFMMRRRSSRAFQSVAGLRSLRDFRSSSTIWGDRKSVV